MSDSPPDPARTAEPSADGFVETEPEIARARLRSEAIGILGLEGGAGRPPELRPVNYAVYRSWIVMRTDRGLLFDAAREHTPASLAVTAVDPETRTAWSVIVKGRLEVGDAGSDGAQLASWAHSGKTERIRLSIDEISGRHLLERPRD
jgi:hypothetical protein